MLGELPLIAEDLGVITPAVERLRDGLGLPGMVVLQFGWVPGAPGNVHDVANHREHRIAYTGTHDNDTLRGWYETLPAATRAAVDATRPHAAGEVWWDLIALTFSSRARVAMVQAQDVLGLGGEARMNQPGTAAGAWKWRLAPLAVARAGAAAARGHRGRRAAGAVTPTPLASCSPR